MSWPLGEKNAPQDFGRGTLAAPGIIKVPLPFKASPSNVSSSESLSFMAVEGNDPKDSLSGGGNVMSSPSAGMVDGDGLCEGIVGDKKGMGDSSSSSFGSSRLEAMAWRGETAECVFMFFCSEGPVAGRVGGISSMSVRFGCANLPLLCALGVADIGTGRIFDGEFLSFVACSVSG
jgi:hypothetical protein